MVVVPLTNTTGLPGPTSKSYSHDNVMTDQDYTASKTKLPPAASLRFRKIDSPAGGKGPTMAMKSAGGTHETIEVTLQWAM